MSEKLILLACDDADQRQVCETLLSEAGYKAIVANSLEIAEQIATDQYFHVALVDSKLGGSDSDPIGLNLVPIIKKEMPWAACVVMGPSRYETLNRAMPELGADQWVERDEVGLVPELLGKLERVYAEKLKINFDLTIEYMDEHQHKQGDDALDAMLTRLDPKQVDIKHSDHRADIRKELADLLGKLFHKHGRIVVDPLVEGYSGARVWRVMPYLIISGRQYDCNYEVLKCGPQKKMEKEIQSFEHYGLRIADNRRPAMSEPAYTTHLGGVLYTYLGLGLENPQDFGAIYAGQQIEAICNILDDLFMSAFRRWYAPREVKNPLNFRKLYVERLITRKRLKEGFEEALPNWKGKDWIRFHELGSQELRTFVYNLPHLPVRFIKGYDDIVTHGDLNGRNILVYDDKTWLIDFYHTGPGHIFRDFVKLESYIKFELMKTESLKALSLFEDTLNAPYPPAADLSFARHWNPEDLTKAYRVVMHLRELAAREAKTSWMEIRDEYCIGLFYQTLAMLQYESIKDMRKKHALISANKIYDLVST